MTKKVLVGLGLVAAVITLILVLYFFYSGGPPSKGREKPTEPGVIYRTIPEVEEKAAPAPMPAAAPQEPPQPSPPQPAAPLEKPATAPEATPQGPKETVLPPLEPKEEHGLLAGSFRNYAAAKKLMEKLKKQGQNAFIKRERGKFQVWVGPFATRKEAGEAAKSLKAKSKISSKIEKFVIPVPK